MINARAKKTAGNICLNLIYALIGAAMLLPIYYLVITTFKTPAEAAASPLGLPEHFTLENYIKALDAMAYGRALCNNLVITGCAVGLLLVLLLRFPKTCLTKISFQHHAFCLIKSKN